MGAKEITLPEGFVPIALGLKFQSALNWSRAGETGLMIQGVLKQVNTKSEVDPITCTEKTQYSYIVTATAPGATITTDLDEVPFEAGEDILVYGTGQLDSYMAKVKVGMEVAINYNGKSKIAGGKRKGIMSHSFTVAAK